MRRTRLSTVACRAMLAVALATSTLRPVCIRAQEARDSTIRKGAVLVTVVDTSINPLAGELVLPGLGLAVRMPEEGALLFVNVPNGIYLIQARHLGYRPEWQFVRVTGDTVRAEFVLAPARHADGSLGVPGDGLAASRMRDFLRRSGAIGVGSFLTRAEIERRRPRNLTALLGRVPGVSVDRSLPGPAVIRSQGTPSGRCTWGMLVFVDAVYLSQKLDELPDGAADAPADEERGAGRLRTNLGLGTSAPRGSWRTARGWAEQTALELGAAEPARRTGARRRTPSAIDRVPIASVVGIEVYPTLVGVPPEFQVRGAECGVVLVWTGR